MTDLSVAPAGLRAGQVSILLLGRSSSGTSRSHLWISRSEACCRVRATADAAPAVHDRGRAGIRVRVLIQI